MFSLSMLLGENKDTKKWADTLLTSFFSNEIKFLWWYKENLQYIRSSDTSHEFLKAPLKDPVINCWRAL